MLPLVLIGVKLKAEQRQFGNDGRIRHAVAAHGDADQPLLILAAEFVQETAPFGFWKLLCVY